MIYTQEILIMQLHKRLKLIDKCIGLSDFVSSVGTKELLDKIENTVKEEGCQENCDHENDGDGFCFICGIKLGKTEKEILQQENPIGD